MSDTMGPDKPRSSVFNFPGSVWQGVRRDVSSAWGRWYPDVRATIVMLRTKSHRRIEMMSALILAVFLPVMLLHTVATTQLTRVTSPIVEIRQLGDPELARERILSENFTTIEDLQVLSESEVISPDMQLVYEHTPLILLYGAGFPFQHNTPVGLYYQLTRSTSGEATATTIRYYLWFIDEPGGTPIDRRLALYGHSFDRELVYRVTLLGDDVVGAYFQAPGHYHASMSYTGETRPVFAIASSNHNFRQVTQRELDHPGEKILLVPLPHRETLRAPAHDPDFAALAVQEIWEKYGIDMSTYVFVEFDIPAEETPVTISVRTEERWFYLHEQVGGGVRRPGYNQVGIEVGYPMLPGDIRELRIVAFSDDPLEFDNVRLTTYPRMDVSL